MRVRVCVCVYVYPYTHLPTDAILEAKTCWRYANVNNNLYKN